MSANSPKTKTRTCFPSLNSCLRGVTNRLSRIFRKNKKKAEPCYDDAEIGHEPNFDSCEEALIFYDCWDGEEVRSVSPDRDEEEHAIVQDKTTSSDASSNESENCSETLGVEKEIESCHSEAGGSTLQGTRSSESGDLNYHDRLVDSSPIPRSPQKVCLERLYSSDPTFCRTSKKVRLQDESYHETSIGHGSDIVLKKTEIPHDGCSADRPLSKRANCSSSAQHFKSSPNLYSAEELQLIRKSLSYEAISRERFQKEIFEKELHVKEIQISIRFTPNANLEHAQSYVEYDLAEEDKYWKRSYCIGSSVCSVSCPTLESNKEVHVVKRVKSEGYTKDPSFDSDSISAGLKQQNEPVTAMQFYAKYDDTQESCTDGIVCNESRLTISTSSLDSEKDYLLGFDNQLTALQISSIDEQNFWTGKGTSSSISSSQETHQNTSPKSCSSESLGNQMPDGEVLPGNITKNSESPVSSFSSTGSEWSSSSEWSQASGSGGAVRKKKKAMKVPRFFIRELSTEEVRTESTARISEAAAQQAHDDGNPMNEVTLPDPARPKNKMANFPLGTRVVLAPPASHPHPRKDRQIYKKAGAMDGISTEEKRTTAKNCDDEARVSRPLPSPVRQHCLLRAADIGVHKLSAGNERHQSYFWADQIEEDQLSFANFEDAQFRTVVNARTLDIQEETEPIFKHEDISSLQLSNQVNISQWDLEVANEYNEAVGKRSDSCPMNSTAKTTRFCRSYRSLPDFRAERRVETSESLSGW